MHVQLVLVIMGQVYHLGGLVLVHDEVVEEYRYPTILKQEMM
jgi:hypothetical protein